MSYVTLIHKVEHIAAAVKVSCVLLLLMFCFLRESARQICSKEILNQQLCLHKRLLGLFMLQTASRTSCCCVLKTHHIPWYLTDRNKSWSLLSCMFCTKRLGIRIWCIITLCEILIRKSKIAYKLADSAIKTSLLTQLKGLANLVLSWIQAKRDIC